MLPGKTVVFTGAFVFSMLVSLGVHGEEEVEGSGAAAALEMKQKMMSLKPDSGGLNIYQNGRKLDLGFFGANIDYFKEVPEALNTARALEGQRIAGFTLYSAGVLTTLADCGLIIYLSATNNQAYLETNRGWILGGLAGGLISELVGAVFMNQAGRTVLKAMNQYNAGILNKYLPEGQRLDLKIIASADQKGIGLNYRF
jgi:hypothetical protein